MDTTGGGVTELLERWKRGDSAAESELIAAVYPVLREIAGAHVRRSSGALTLQATELANEAYEKIVKQRTVDWQNRQHFFAVAATVIRRVTIDYLRERGAAKRGGRSPFVSLADLHDGNMPSIDENMDWLGLDEALSELAKVDAACARVVELKFFSDLTNEEIADVCGNSLATVKRQWRFARAWLGNRLGTEASPD